LNAGLRKRVSQIAETSHSKVDAELLRISFDYIDWNLKTFFVHGCTETYYHHLFETFCAIKKSTAKQIKERQQKALNPKPIVWQKKTTITL